jgi:hypothetical protein
MTPIVIVILVIVAIGVALYLINRFVPMSGYTKSILNWVVTIAIILWLLRIFGVWQWLSRITV